MTLRPDTGGGSRILLVGLTGGIATGKTTVAGMFRELGIPVIDADAIVHELLSAGGRAVQLVSEAFGESIVTPRGGVNRQRLADIVFADQDGRRRLERIVHPLVVEESRGHIERVASTSDAAFVVYDAALLVETGRHEEFDRLVVVSTRPELQLQRLVDRDRLTPDQAGARVRSQMPLCEKVGHADYVIDNSGHWQDTRRQVTNVIVLLEEDAELLRSGRPLPIRRVVPS
ncbi:MAG: dephospho-CoA kinase [Acidobacteriota bacterium]|nr:dephospho-CoA kinase [Acidobacteriota bacterium]